jgi:hypothetical protein
MSRISRLERSQITPEMAALYEKTFALRGNVSNIFRVMAPVKPGEGGCAA